MSDLETSPSATDREPPFPTESESLEPPPNITPISDTVPTIDPSSTILPSDVNSSSVSTPPSQTEEDSSTTIAPSPSTSISTSRTRQPISSSITTRSVEPSTQARPTNNGWVTSIRTSTSSSADPEATSKPVQEAVSDEPVSQRETRTTSEFLPQEPGEDFAESESAPAVSSDGDASQSRVTSAVPLQATAGARLPSTASTSAIAKATPLDGANEALSPDEPTSNEDSLDGSAKAGLAVGILTAVCAIILGIFLFRKRVIAQRRRKCK